MSIALDNAELTTLDTMYVILKILENSKAIYLENYLTTLSMTWKKNG